MYSVSLLDREKEDFETVKININELTNLLNTTEKRYTEFRTVAENLISKTLYIKKEDSELITGWLSSMEYIKDEGVIELEFSKKLMPYLLQLKEKFTRYKLENILNLKNKHSIRVFELMKQYENIGKRKITLEAFRRCLGIREDEYTRFSNFEHRVLKTTREEINEYTDIIIDYEKIKTGRKITDLLFTINPQDHDEKRYVDFLDEYYDIDEIKIKMGLKDENFNNKQIIKIYEKAVEIVAKDETSIFEYVRLNYLYIKGKKGIKNTYSYLLKAIHEDFATAKGQISLEYYIHNKNS